MASHTGHSLEAKALSAFYTPETLADFLVQWVVQSGTERLLEPSVGEGALIKAALSYAGQRWGTTSGIRFLACDINPKVTGSLLSWLPPDHDIRTVDFLRIRPETIPPVQGVVTNPPFTRNHSLPADRRDELRRQFDVTGAAGLWVPFLIHSCSFLERGGRLAAVIPASALFTRYGKEALARVCGQFATAEIRRIADRPRWQNGAEERGAILLAAGYRKGSSEVPTPTLWTAAGTPLRSAIEDLCTPFREGLVAARRLGDIAHLSIGAVTGNNRIFLLNEQDRADLDIEVEDLKHVVSRGRQVPGIQVSQNDLRTAAKLGEKTWLLSPRNASVKHAGVRKRLAEVSATERRNTVWFRKRRPWWKVDAGADCDAVFTYMNDRGPRIVLCEPEISCTNTLHRISFSETAGPETKSAAAVSMIGTFNQLAAELSGRVYGGGVLKFELSETRNLPVLLDWANVGHEALSGIDNALRSAQLEAAREMADELLLPRLFGKAWKRAAAEMGADLARIRSARHGV